MVLVFYLFTFKQIFADLKWNWLTLYLVTNNWKLKSEKNENVIQSLNFL